MGSLAHGNGRWVAEGGGALHWSDDGILPAAPPQPYDEGTAFIGDRYLFFGSDELGNPLLFESFDAQTWTEAMTLLSARFSAGPGGNPRVVGFSVEQDLEGTSPPDTTGIMLRDDDLWSGFAVPELPVRDLACGDSACIGLSSDGLVRSHGDTAAWEWHVVGTGGEDVIADGTEFVTVGSTIQRSVDDGVTWTTVVE